MAIALQDAVNSVAWQGCAPRTVRCVSVDASSMYENGFAFWQVTYNFSLKWDTWDKEVLDAGFSERRYNAEQGGGAMKRFRIADAAGRDPSVPWELNGNGELLKVGEPPVYRKYRVYREVNFATLVV